jgi:methionine aminopeptidase
MVGKVDQASKDLIKASYECLLEAIAAGMTLFNRTLFFSFILSVFDVVTAKPGTMVRDFGNFISKRAAKSGYNFIPHLLSLLWLCHCVK